MLSYLPRPKNDPKGLFSSRTKPQAIKLRLLDRALAGAGATRTKKERTARAGRGRSDSTTTKLVTTNQNSYSQKRAQGSATTSQDAKLEAAACNTRLKTEARNRGVDVLSAHAVLA